MINRLLIVTPIFGFSFLLHNFITMLNLGGTFVLVLKRYKYRWHIFSIANEGTQWGLLAGKHKLFITTNVIPLPRILLILHAILA